MASDEVTTAHELRRRWAALESAWAEATAAAEALPAGAVDERVDGEWSFAETLRHLVFATDAWLQRPVLSQASPYWPAGLPHTECPDAEFAAFGIDRSITPRWDEVLTRRAERQALVRSFVAAVTDDDLGRRCDPGFPPSDLGTDSDTLTIGACLDVILEEEEAHLGYAMRDIAAIRDRADGDDWLLQGSTDVTEVAGIYDEWAERYDGDLDDWSYRAPDVVAANVVAHAPHARSVLDAGCGTGLVGLALRAAGFAGDIHGIDVSTASLEVAARTGTYASLAPADLQRPLDRPDDDVDALVCVGVMTYVPAVEAAWREFVRVVRSGGLVVVTQREDLWEPRECSAIVDRLAAEGLWEPIEVTDPQPYLPDNPDGMSAVGVRYLTARVR